MAEIAPIDTAGLARAAGVNEATQFQLSRFCCDGCGYGASCRVAPERCPMCGGSTWEYEAWRPFSNLVSDLAPQQGTPTFLQ